MKLPLWSRRPNADILRSRKPKAKQTVDYHAPSHTETKLSRPFQLSTSAGPFYLLRRNESLFDEDAHQEAWSVFT